MRAILLAVVAAALMIGVIELQFRRAGGMPSIVPGLTRTEYQWKIRRAREHDRVVYLVGDSRAGWGFAESVFNTTVRRLVPRVDVVGVNAGVPASSIATNIEFITRSETKRPQTIVVNFSPLGAYHFLNFPSQPIPGLKIQDLLDDELNSELAEYLWTRGRPTEVADEVAAYRQRGRVSSAVNWISRTVHADGLISAQLGTNDGSPVDPARYQLEYFHQFATNVTADPREARRRRDELSGVIRNAVSAGWAVMLVRFPIGAHMRALEETLPSDLRPDVLARESRIPYLDYAADPRTASLPTVDESHLTPASARALAAVLADDLSRVLIDDSIARAKTPE